MFFFNSVFSLSVVFILLEEVQVTVHAPIRHNPSLSDQN